MPKPIFFVRLWDRDGQSQIELAKSAGLKQPTVVRTLDRMERDGLIVHARNKQDWRIFNFYLTEKAKKVCAKLEDSANAMHETATINMTKKNIEILNKNITQVINNLEKHIEEKEL